jgi:hypothetical protein
MVGKEIQESKMIDNRGYILIGSTVIQLSNNGKLKAIVSEKFSF